jgi:hypothetical protein
VFASNILFALRSDYFGGDEGYEPLVHTWSLSVEEQFYLIYPVLLFFLLRHRPRAVLPVVAAMFATSFVLAIATAETAPRFAFNLLPMRAWELLAGAVCALVPAVERIRQFPGLVGMALVGAGMVIISPSTPAPGVMFLLPVIGTALIIRYGVPGTWTARFLGFRPFVLIGLISYGFYLWHQALLVFVFYTHFGPAPVWLRVAAIALSMVLATASYLWIEQPVRRRRILASRGLLALVCVGGLGLAFAVGVAGFFERVESRSGQQSSRLDTAYAGTFEGRDVRPGRSQFLLYGDSHARQYITALTEDLGKGAMIADNNCLSLPDATSRPSPNEPRDACIDQYRTALRLVEERRIPVLIWAQRWERDLFANSNGANLGSNIGVAEPFFRAQLRAIRAALPAQTQLVLVGNEPTAAVSAPQMEAGILRCRAYANVTCPTRFAAELAEGRAANRILSDFASHTPGVTYVDAADALCTDDHCTILDGDRLYYSDGDHLTTYAARLVTDRVIAAMSK